MFEEKTRRRNVESRYNLYGFIIVETEKGLGWIQHLGDMNDTGEMIYIAGSAYVLEEYDVLLLGRSRLMEAEKEMKTFDDIEKYLEHLPKWDKTKYYVKLADIELYSLIECKTGEVVYSEKNHDILRSLRLIEKNRNIRGL